MLLDGLTMKSLQIKKYIMMHHGLLILTVHISSQLMYGKKSTRYLTICTKFCRYNILK
jgi:hypothetical protein